MSTRLPGPTITASALKTPFQAQRDALVTEIAQALEHVLQNINRLNRSLEGVTAVGNEFGAVEALWSQFEGVMAQPEDKKEGRDGEGGEDEVEDGYRDEEAENEVEEGETVEEEDEQAHEGARERRNGRGR